MSVRIRFVLILTLVVSIILLSALFVVYTLYSRTREQDFDKRLWAHAYNKYISYYNIKDIDSAVKEQFANYLPGSPINFKATIYDSAYQIVSSDTFIAPGKIDTAFLQKLNVLKTTHFSYNDIQGIGIFIDRGGKKGYIVATGYDKYSVERLTSLRIIMGFVAAGSIFIVGFFAFVYVIIATRPLVRLSVQMRRITQNNLKQRVEIQKGNVKYNEIVQIATNFNNMLDRLEKAFELQKNFVHHASHELRTPLATMLSQTESALRKELSADDAKKVLVSLKEDQQEMINLTNSLLLLSQYENVHYSSNWPKVRIDEVIMDSIADMQKMFPDISVGFGFVEQPEKDSYLFIPGNETLLRSAFRNLLRNAYLYSDNRHATISLEVAQKFVNIHFENNGPTVKPEESERMFLPFFRGGNAQQKRGFGLGLAIVKRISELHKGDITYNALNGNINRFTLFFPVYN